MCRIGQTTVCMLQLESPSQLSDQADPPSFTAEAPLHIGPMAHPVADGGFAGEVVHQNSESAEADIVEAAHAHLHLIADLAALVGGRRRDGDRSTLIAIILSVGMHVLLVGGALAVLHWTGALGAKIILSSGNPDAGHDLFISSAETTGAAPNNAQLPNVSIPVTPVEQSHPTDSAESTDSATPAAFVDSAPVPSEVANEAEAPTLIQVGSSERFDVPVFHRPAKSIAAATMPTTAPSPTTIPSSQPSRAFADANAPESANPAQKPGGLTIGPRLNRAGTAALVGQRGLGGVDSRGLPIPDYPIESRRRGEQGAVELEFEVLADGSVGAIKDVRGCHFHRLIEAATTALRAAKFEPAITDGKPVVSISQVSYLFTLK